jgi:hypothetical protein
MRKIYRAIAGKPSRQPAGLGISSHCLTVTRLHEYLSHVDGGLFLSHSSQDKAFVTRLALYRRQGEIGFDLLDPDGWQL